MPALAQTPCGLESGDVGLSTEPGPDHGDFGIFLQPLASDAPCPAQSGAVIAVRTGTRRLALPAGQDDLPQLGLWFDIERLSVFLAGRDVASNTRDLMVTLGPASPPMTLPIIDERVIKLGARDVIAVQVLLPVARAAVTDWQRATAERAAIRAPVVVMDTSGSAREYLDSFLTDLIRPLVRADAALADVLVLTTTDGLALSQPQAMTIADLTRTGPKPPDPAERAFDATALLQNRRVFILFGGDLAVPDVIADAPRDRVDVIQITPELDPELADSVAAMGLSDRLRAYDALNPLTVAAVLQAETGFKSTKSLDDDIDAALAKGQIAAGFPVITPQTPQAEAALRDVVSAAKPWRALPVWVIRNDLLMRVVSDVP